MATRWHEDDLSGRLIKRGWKFLNLPALAEEKDPLGRKPGEALCPERWPADYLAQLRVEVGDYRWWALYQGRPRPRGGSLFQGVHLVPELPQGGRRVGVGVDLAYSKRTHADYSACVVMARSGDEYYILDVLRMQERAPEFARHLDVLLQRYPGVVPWWYAAGPETGVADLITSLVKRQINCLPASSDKFTRAQAFAAAWNAGKVFVPQGAPWAELFLAEMLAFTGLGDAHDDQVDAAVAAFDSLAVKPVARGVGLSPLGFF